MSRTVGRLNAILGLNNTEFVQKLNSAKQQSIGFAKDLTALPSFAGKSLSQIAGIATGTAGAIKASFASLGTGVASVVKLIPGIGLAAESIAHPFEAAKRSMEGLDQLSKQASRLNLDPQFLKGLTIAAEDEAGAIGSVMARLLRFQGQLKAGGDEQMQAGGSSAAKLAQKWGLDFEQIKQANPEQLLGIISEKIASLEDPALQVAAAMDLAGKGAANFMNTLRDPEAIEQWTQKVRALGIATAENIAIAKAWDDAQKDIALKLESYSEKRITGFGQLGAGKDMFMGGDYGRGFDFMTVGSANIARGVLNAFNPFSDDFFEAQVPAEIADKMFGNANKAMMAAGIGGDSSNPLVKRLRELEMLRPDSAEGFMGMNALKEVGQLTQQFEQQRLKKGGFTSVEEETALTAYIAKLKEATAIQGLSAEEAEIYHMREEIHNEKSRDQAEQLIRAKHEKIRLQKEESDALQESMALADAEASKMTAWAEAKRQRTMDPLVKLAGLDNDQVLGGLEALERQFNLGGPARYSGAMEAGSAAAYSSMVQRSGNDGADMATRLDRVREAIDNVRKSTDAQTKQLLPLLQKMVEGQPGIMD